MFVCFLIVIRTYIVAVLIIVVIARSAHPLSLPRKKIAGVIIISQLRHKYSIYGYAPIPREFPGYWLATRLVAILELFLYNNTATVT